MQEMGRVNEAHKSRIVQPVQASLATSFISLFTPRVLQIPISHFSHFFS